MIVFSRAAALLKGISNMFDITVQRVEESSNMLYNVAILSSLTDCCLYSHRRHEHHLRGGQGGSADISRQQQQSLGCPGSVIPKNIRFVHLLDQNSLRSWALNIAGSTRLACWARCQLLPRPMTSDKLSVSCPARSGLRRPCNATSRSIAECVWWRWKKVHTASSQWRWGVALPSGCGSTRGTPKWVLVSFVPIFRCVLICLFSPQLH